MVFIPFADAIFIPDGKGDLISLESALPLQEMPNPPADFGAAFMKMILTFIGLIALLFISYWFIRRMIQNRLQRGVGEQLIQIVEKRMISSKTMLYIVEVEGKKILLAESHLEIKRIESWDDQALK